MRGGRRLRRGWGRGRSCRLWMGAWIVEMFLWMKLVGSAFFSFEQFVKHSNRWRVSYFDIGCGCDT